MKKSIRAILEFGKPEFFASIPKDLLEAGDEIDAFNFINTYRDKFSKYPTFERLVEEFEDFKRVKSTLANPIEDTINEDLKKRKQTKASTRLSKIVNDLNNGAELDLKEYQKIGDMYSRGVTPVLKSNTFTVDDLLFKNGTFKIGIDKFDEQIKGIAPGEVFAVIARPNVGKTIFCIWMSYQWIMNGRKVLFISCEMSYKAIGQRFVSMYNKYDPVEWRDYYAKSAPQQMIMANGIDAFTSGIAGELILGKQASYAVSDIRSLIQEHQPDAVMIDAFYKIAGEGNEDEYVKVKNAIRELSTLSLSSGVPIFVSSQFGRGATANKKPTLETIAFSDAIAQEATFVLALEVDSSIDENLYKSELIKSRSKGKNTIIEFERNPDILTFTEKP